MIDQMTPSVRKLHARFIPCNTVFNTNMLELSSIENRQLYISAYLFNKKISATL